MEQIVSHGSKIKEDPKKEKKKKKEIKEEEVKADEHTDKK